MELSGLPTDDQLEYDIVASDLMAREILEGPVVAVVTNTGEALPAIDSELKDTMAAPGAVALDASTNRLELISRMGTDVAAMALDASETMKASNSLEKMLAHQLAVCHEVSMRYVTKASLEPDQVQSIRMMNLSIRTMETYQKGLLTLKRLRSSGEQRITIQHVSVTDGGQAVIGQVQSGGGAVK
jgi:hypothetical protein